MRDLIIASELNRIAKEHGGHLRPADVVEAARPEDSPLHKKFEWDDSEAAERYRVWQARQLIAVTVEYIGGGKDATLSRVFVSLTPDREEDGGYRSVEAVMSNPEWRKQLLEDALAEAKRFQQKYRDLKELAAIFGEIEKVAEKAMT